MTLEQSGSLRLQQLKCFYAVCIVDYFTFYQFLRNRFILHIKINDKRIKYAEVKNVLYTVAGYIGIS